MAGQAKGAEEKGAKQHRALFPGRTVELQDLGIVVVVHPLGLRHMRRFSSQIASALSILATLGIGKDAAPDKKAQAGQTIVAKLVPFVLANLFDLVAECCTVEPDDVKLEELAHWHLPPIVQAWIEESFGDEKKWAPWAAALKEISRRFPDLAAVSTSLSASNGSSPQGTESTTS